MASPSSERAPADRQLLELVASAFDAAGLRAALIGGMARNLWSAPRLTYDLDFTVAAQREAIAEAVRLLIDAGFRVVRNQDPGTSSGPDFLQLYNDRTYQVIEFQTAKVPFQDDIVERSIPIDGLEPIRLATAEDMVVLKLIAFRRKDHDDLLELARVPNLDWSYIERWAETWDITDRLQQLRQWIAEDQERLRDLHS